MINQPKYILTGNINNHHIDYEWNDSQVFQHFNLDIAPQFIARLENVSLRAKTTLVIGCYEWVLGRFYSMIDNDFFIQLQEAAWCANVNKNYIRQNLFFERDKFLGPIESALWYAYSCVIPVLYISEGITEDEFDDDKEFFADDYFFDENEWKNSLSHLIPLIVYILPSDKTHVFLHWLEQVIDRLVGLYTMPEKSLFDNLWGYANEKDWLGDYVAREVLDPDCDYQQEQVLMLINQFLQKVDKSNPLLTPYPELKEKIDTPYQV